MQIEICSRQKSIKAAALSPDSNIISIVDWGKPHPEFERFNRRLRLAFNDVVSGHKAPRPIHIRQIIDFAQSIDERPLIVHCESGISRSSAAALIVFSFKFGPAGIQDYFRPMLGLIHPNIAMINMADGILGNDGALIAQAEKIRNWDILIELSGGGKV